MSEAESFRRGVLNMDLRIFDDHLGAMLTVMNVLHLRSSNVPVEVDLDGLVHIATISDEYNCTQAMMWHCHRWLDGLRRQGVTPSLSDDALKWIWVSYVFGLEKEFKLATTAEQKNATGMIEPDHHLRFPIPP